MLANHSSQKTFLDEEEASEWTRNTTTTPCKPKQDVEKDVRDMHVLVLLLEIRLQKGQKSNFVQGIVVQIPVARVSCFVML